MHGVTSKFVWMAGMVVAMSASACSAGGVGDPCIPESIPCDPNNPNDCGFDSSESYVEGSSVQCRTRTCVVHQLQGDPEIPCPEDDTQAPAANCVSARALDERVFCSCRCDAPQDVKDQGNFQFCSCPDGFVCEEILGQGGDGIRGSYCVKPVEN